jgi:hypothetical protein
LLQLLRLAGTCATWLAAALAAQGEAAREAPAAMLSLLPAQSGKPYDFDVDLAATDVAPSCISSGRCAFPREVFVDYAAFGLPALGGQWITYDYDEVTRPIAADKMGEESELSLAVRLVISEIGADRMLVNRNAVLEAIGILYTVDNRRDPSVYNPESRPEAPMFPGCGPGASFAACANAQQYLGMATWRATNPGRSYDDQELERATDLAVTAWWVQKHGYVLDFTRGATNYVHRCGDAAYGLATPACDGHLGRPAGDVAGGNPHTGPIVFKAPGRWNASRGVYDLIESRQIEYDPWWRSAADAVADADPLDDASGIVPSRFGSADQAEPDPALDAVVSGVEPVADRSLLQRILVAR